MNETNQMKLWMLGIGSWFIKKVKSLMIEKIKKN
jgi:hypothetical protein